MYTPVGGSRFEAFQTILICLLLTVSGCTVDSDQAGQATGTQVSEQAELVRHTVMADGHPVALWEKSAAGATEAILLVHGRTWSALPDFDLQVEGEDLSLMDGLVEEGYAVFAIDLRGYGGTPRDESEWMTPNRSADDVASAVSWIAASRSWQLPPHLFGWSMGATIAQLTVQRHPDLVSSLTLFGYWLDSDYKFPADGANGADIEPAKEMNTAEAAASDFIIEGSISQKAIDTYVSEALMADPVKVDLKNLDHYNMLDGAEIRLPVLILQGEHDPVGPTAIQAKLFQSLATGHKQWITVPGGDHAALLETPRDYFIHSLVSFLEGVSEQR
jgi:pimeloyl-ACP methyl ester carboxylesterase